MLNIVIFGPPGSGKGTQSENLIKKYGFDHISTGDLLRHEIETNTQLGYLAKQHMDKGELVPDEVVIGMIDSFLDKNVKSKGVIFDGFPRTTDQAKALKEMLASYDTDVAILLDLEVPEDELTKRILERGKTSGRTDDANIETIKNRIAEYNKKTKPVMDFYAAEGKKVVINGVGSVDEIFANLCKAIDAVK
ncbi:MAG: adenylate kinase [Bacteroidales bacterium]|jgi:adenylate kinase|nr:adenylate kinase [Bacteroidales bacterium]MBP5418903.1 adenylate kinase [Bacteroidales bacterium]MCR5697398.1 adenylate kinase [Marinilabiliaceae bacterium]